MKKTKKIILSTICMFLLLISVFSTTASAGNGSWTRFTQASQGFTLTGSWRADVSSTGMTTTSQARGYSIIRCAIALAGVRHPNGLVDWGPRANPGFTSVIIHTGSVVTATRLLTVQ